MTEEISRDFCVGCPYFPYCRDKGIDGVFIGEHKKCEEND